jgi:hypothetical protein
MQFCCLFQIDREIAWDHPMEGDGDHVSECSF